MWTLSDVRAALLADEAVNAAIRAYGVTEFGTLADPHHEEAGEEDVRSSTRRPRSSRSRRSAAMPIDVVRAAPIAAVRGMHKWRDEWPKPFRDEKILASWNIFMIGACAEVALATGDSAARAMAERAFEAIEETHFRREGAQLRLMRVANIPGFLDDYAFLANAALDPL